MGHFPPQLDLLWKHIARARDPFTPWAGWEETSIILKGWEQLEVFPHLSILQLRLL